MTITGHPMTSVGTRSPVLAAGIWFDEEDRPLSLRMELPLSPDLMVAALYADTMRHGTTTTDLTEGEEVWGYVALAVTRHGLEAIEQTGGLIAAWELDGAIVDPAWLAFLRCRVAEVTGAAPHWLTPANRHLAAAAAADRRRGWRASRIDEPPVIVPPPWLRGGELASQIHAHPRSRGN